MGNSKHSSRDIFAAIKAIKRSFASRVQSPKFGVRARVYAAPTYTAMTIEVFNNRTDAVHCVFEIPQILEIEDSGNTLGILKNLPFPTITRVSDGTSTIECHREITGQYDEDLNGETLSADDIAAAMCEEIKSVF